jgi:hypothetical protein
MKLAAPVRAISEGLIEVSASALQQVVENSILLSGIEQK